MNVLILGLGADSQIIRGDQLGAAIGARVRRRFALEDVAWADVVVLLKRAGPRWAELVRAVGKPLVWDALDFWQQPEDNGLGGKQSMRLLLEWKRTIAPAVTICATQAMADVCGGVYLPHHARPGLTTKPVREAVQIVAYEGVRKYLGAWESDIRAECERRGWQFVINPQDLSEADILVAFRDGQWDGWMCRNWKSGVKYVNAIACGRPMITQDTRAASECGGIGVSIENHERLSEAFDRFVDMDSRQRVSEMSHGDRFSLNNIALEYQAILESVAMKCF